MVYKEGRNTRSASPYGCLHSDQSPGVALHPTFPSGLPGYLPPMKDLS